MFEPAVDRSASQQPDEDYVATYYPGTTDAASAATVDVAPGAQIRGIDFTLSKARTRARKGPCHQCGRIGQEPDHVDADAARGDGVLQRDRRVTDTKGSSNSAAWRRDRTR